jgi:RNA polymerase sigma-70 factor (ECF subfamily)
LGLARCREELFDRIIDENKKRLVAITRSYADSLNQDDLYQEILFQIWRSLGSFAERCKLSTWVYRVALNTGMRFSRDATLRHNRTTGDTGESQKDQAVKLGPFSEFQLLEDFIHSLGAADRGLFLLYLDNVSYEEISEVLDIDEAVIRVKISRIKKKYTERYLGT